MSTQLHQLTIKYLPTEDRLLLRIGTTEKTEYRMWLTRRFVVALWPSLGGNLAETADLVGALSRKPPEKAQASPGSAPASSDADPPPLPPVSKEVKDAVLGMEHQEAVQESNFQQAHEEDNVDLTANTGPMVITGAKVRPWDGKKLVLGLQTQNGMNVSVSLDKKLLHGFCHMIASTVEKAGWGLNLTIGDPAAQAAKGPQVVH